MPITEIARVGKKRITISYKVCEATGFTIKCNGVTLQKLYFYRQAYDFALGAAAMLRLIDSHPKPRLTAPAQKGPDDSPAKGRSLRGQSSATKN